MRATDMSRQQIESAVRETITTVLPSIRAEEIMAGQHLKDLGADSVDRVEIIMLLLERLRLKEPMASFGQIPTIDALVTFLYERCSA